MLVGKRNEAPHGVSPFLYEGLAQKPQEQSRQGVGYREQRGEYSPLHPANSPSTSPLPENNRGRTFRRAGNACEIVAGSCLNSAVIFTFHLLQVHPVGMFLAVGTAHLYFTATATGEGFNKFVTNLMTGCSASLALFCALSDPIGEWNEARTSTDTAKTEIELMYQPKTEDYSSWVSGAGLAIFIAILMIFLFGGKKGK